MYQFHLFFIYEKYRARKQPLVPSSGAFFVGVNGRKRERATLVSDHQLSNYPDLSILPALTTCVALCAGQQLCHPLAPLLSNEVAFISHDRAFRPEIDLPAYINDAVYLLHVF